MCRCGSWPPSHNTQAAISKSNQNVFGTWYISRALPDPFSDIIMWRVSNVTRIHGRGGRTLLKELPRIAKVVTWPTAATQETKTPLRARVNLKTDYRVSFAPPPLNYDWLGLFAILSLSLKSVCYTRSGEGGWWWLNAMDVTRQPATTYEFARPSANDEPTHRHTTLVYNSRETEEKCA